MYLVDYRTYLMSFMCVSYPKLSQAVAWPLVGFENQVKYVRTPVAQTFGAA
jgi:hypothetical protein